VPATSAVMTRRQINLIVAGLVIGMFLAALDQMVVSTAIRTIGDDLDGLTLQAWVVTAYMIASTLSTPLYGKLSDIFGRKPLYVISLSLFISGSVLCGIATDMYELAAFRAVQGLGGGGLMALALIILGDILSPRERTKYQAAFFGVWGIASVLGPVLGGFFAGAGDLLGVAGWRWIFLINVPLGAIAMVVIVRVLQIPHQRRSVVIDYWGVAALVVAIAPLLVVVEQGREWGWASPLVLGLAALSVVGVAAFVMAERRAGDAALLPMRMFSNTTFAVSAGVNFIMGLAMFGGLAGLPLYLQIGKGMSPTAAGLAMLPFTLGILIMATVTSTAIRRTGRYKWMPIFGTGMIAVASVVLSTMEASSSLWHLSVGATMFGMGLGSIMQPVMLAVQNAVAPRDMGTGSASVMFFRQIGGSLGTALFLSLMFGSVGGEINEEFAQVSGSPAFEQTVGDPQVMADPVNAAAASVIASGSLNGSEALGLSLDDTSFIQDLHPVLAAPFQAGFADAITRVILMTAGVVLIAFALAWRLPELPLREKSGLQSIADEDDELASAQAPQEPLPGETRAAHIRE